MAAVSNFINSITAINNNKTMLITNIKMYHKIIKDYNTYKFKNVSFSVYMN
jgi:hypothetical protein